MLSSLRLVYIPFLALLMTSSLGAPSRLCPLDRYCPDGYSCEDSTECVDSCYTIKATSQGNGTTGRCEDVSSDNRIWFDSSSYEVFVYRQLHQNETLKIISLISTHDFWSNASNTDEEFPNNVMFTLTSSRNYINFTVTSSSTTFRGFNNENTPDIVRNVSVISLSQNLMLGDYNMKIQAIWQDVEIAESDIIIHVVDPLPRALPVPVTCVQFESENYTVSSLDLSLSVTLTLSGSTQSEPFDVFVIAEDTLSADSQDFTPGWYRATFNPRATTATTNEIPILSRALDKSIEQFSLELYIPSASYKIGIQSGAVKKAIANIIDEIEAYAAIGEDINVPPFVHLTISCSHLINTLVPHNVTWSAHGDIVAENHSKPNTLISNDGHLLIITSTLLTVGGQIGSRGTYACTVCSDNGTCTESQSHCEICEVPRLAKAAAPITRISTRDHVLSILQCGENLCIGSSLPISILFTCTLMSSEAPDREINVYKDNLFRSSGTNFLLLEALILNNLGTYRAVLNDTCGTDTATSVLSLCDLMAVYFDEPVFTGSELSGNITVSMTLVRDTIMNGEITVVVIPFDLSPLSAQGNGVDYPSTPINAIFPAGVNNTTVDIPVTGDDIVEENETFRLEIFVPVPAKYAVELGNPSKASVIIVDNSTTFVNFEQSTYSVYEDSGLVELVLVLSNPSSTDLIIRVKMFDQKTSATEGLDFSLDSYNILFPAGVTRVAFNVTIIEDNILELNETFAISTDPLTLPNKVTIGSSSHTTVTIIDDDTSTVNIEQSTYSVYEDTGSVQLVLVLSNPSSTDLMIEVKTFDQKISTTATEKLDFDSGPYNVLFPAGATTVRFNVTIIEDNILEHNESFSLSIDPLTLPSGVTVGSTNHTTVAIIDDDTSDVNFDQSTYNVYEDSGHAELVLVLSNPSSTDLTIGVKMFDQQTPASAMEGSDFIFVPHNIFFPAGVTRVTFNVTIIEDNILERDEFFSLSVDPLTLPDRVTAGNFNDTTITIMNDDRLAVRFAQSVYTVDEDQGSLQVVLVLSNPSSYLITVPVLNTDESATGGDDYDSGPYSVTFPPGNNSAAFDIAIIFDEVEEDSETFTLSIAPFLPPLITYGNIILATVTIIDKTVIDDEPFLAIGLIAGISAGVLIAIVLLIVIIGILYHLNKVKKGAYKLTPNKEMVLTPWENKADAKPAPDATTV